MSCCPVQTFGDCSICMEVIHLTNIAVTECGHMFHSKCIFQNLNHRVECPMCRTTLVDAPEEDESVWETDSEDGDEEDEEGDEGEEEAEEPGITLEQIEKKLSGMGYSFMDALFMMVSSPSSSAKNKERYTEDFEEKFADVIDKILDGEIAVDYRDTRTYAQVLLQPAVAV